ncbi:MAG TPA: hypothetical protein VIK01_27220 [Polyangiaceae bacterium]
MLFRHEGLLRSEAPADAPAPSGFVVERPPPGLARGRYPAPEWSIALLGAALVLTTLLYFFVRLRKRRS